jgi:hypothetical protein
MDVLCLLPITDYHRQDAAATDVDLPLQSAERRGGVCGTRRRRQVAGIGERGVYRAQCARCGEAAAAGAAGTGSLLQECVGGARSGPGDED